MQYHIQGGPKKSPITTYFFRVKEFFPEKVVLVKVLDLG